MVWLRPLDEWQPHRQFGDEQNPGYRSGLFYTVAKWDTKSSLNVRYIQPIQSIASCLMGLSMEHVKQSAL